jgi:DNA N-6-adenine-methyltransferase (Dam)
MSGSLFQAADIATRGKDEWITPPEIIAALAPFDLDPCAPVNPPYKIAENTFTELDNGLLRPWRGFVWCNPPYSEAGKWLGRCAEHGSAIALVFARTETNSFFQNVWQKASAVRFLRGRISFYHVDGRRGASAPAPSVLVAYGAEAAARLESAKTLGGAFLSLPCL